ncbi:MAG: hypothetical protein QOF57_2008 [Frankiaceae bacterium]|nr:hypothetical protein [Frankiaceae bacterium]
MTATRGHRSCRPTGTPDRARRSRKPAIGGRAALIERCRIPVAGGCPIVGPPRTTAPRAAGWNGGPQALPSGQRVPDRVQSFRLGKLRVASGPMPRIAGRRWIVRVRGRALDRLRRIAGRRWIVRVRGRAPEAELRAAFRARERCPTAAQAGPMRVGRRTRGAVPGATQAATLVAATTVAPSAADLEPVRQPLSGPPVRALPHPGHRFRMT